MSQSLARVRQALIDHGLPDDIREPGACRTAQEAADACGCALDQIVKSLIFQGESGALYLFLTAGGNRLDTAKATALAGEALTRADPGVVRARTGFAIGGVAPLGHVEAPRTMADPRLCDFDTVFAAAGTPRHVFAVNPRALVETLRAPLVDFVA